MGATLALLAKYRDTWRAAWDRRKLLEAPPRLAHEAQFLPPALALQDTPVHPAPRYIQWTIMAFVGLALLWPASVRSMWLPPRAARSCRAARAR